MSARLNAPFTKLFIHILRHPFFAYCGEHLIHSKPPHTAVLVCLYSDGLFFIRFIEVGKVKMQNLFKWLIPFFVLGVVMVLIVTFVEPISLAFF